ncbi:MAG: ketopantoate reductase family protein, partial [Kiloniellaceae bacterium]
MRYAIMGTGGLGGYFGARLAADGNEVVFIARGAQRAALAREGLRVRSALGDIYLPHPEVPERIEDAGFVDIVLFCVKLWDVEAAAEAIRPLLSRDTAVIPFQNGVDAVARLSACLGAAHVMGGVAKISATLERPGMVRHDGTLAALIFGEVDGGRSWRAECMDAACQGAGIEARLSEDIALDIWEKFVFLAPIATAACLERAPIGAVLGDPAARARLASLIEEAVAVGRAKGIALAPDAAART